MLLAAACSSRPAAAAAADAALDFDYREIPACSVKTGKHSRVKFDFGAERMGYITVKGSRLGDGIGPLRYYEATVSDALELEDVVLHAVKCPINLSALSFACSDGNLQAFWADCLRLTENKVIAKRLGDEALARRFDEELKAEFASAMPKAAESANPLGVIVRQYLGVTADRDKRQVEIYPKLVQGMTCVAADFDPTNPGYELWMGKNEPYWDLYGRELEGISHIGWERDLVWWKGDMLRSRIDNGVKLNHWDWEAQKWNYDPVLRSDKSLGGGIKRLPFPILVAAILGDWREEVVLPADGGNALLVFVSPQPTPYRFHTFMHDPVYRLSVAAWNTAYNQAPQAGFYFGPDLLGHGIWFRGTFLK